MMLILGLLGIYFDAAVVFVTNSSLLFRLAVAILCALSYPYGPKLKIYVGNCAEEHSVISSLCLVILIRGSLALQCRLVCLRKCSVSSVISSGVPSLLPLLLPGMSLISTPLVVSVPSVPPPPPLSRGVRGWEWGWLQLVVARLEKKN